MSASRRESNDAIAREAARLLAIGRAEDMDQAIALARQSVDVNGQASRMRVRRHAQAMSMQAVGEEAYRRRQREMLMLAEEIMTAIEQAFPESGTLLVGRAAGGHFDGDPSIHIRVHNDESTDEIARVLSEFGFDDADFAFTTLDTAHVGRLSQVEWTENEPTVRIVLTRCPSLRVFESASDLVTGKSIATLTLEQVAERLKR